MDPQRRIELVAVQDRGREPSVSVSEGRPGCTERSRRGENSLWLYRPHPDQEQVYDHPDLCDRGRDGDEGGDLLGEVGDQERGEHVHEVAGAPPRRAGCPAPWETTRTRRPDTRAVSARGRRRSPR